jgi:hypothetical protein
MAGIDDIEEFVDEEIYKEQRDALTKVMDALAPLSRERRRKILECAKQFFDLPRHD